MKTILVFAALLLTCGTSSLAQELAHQSQPAKSPAVIFPVALKAPPVKYPKGAPVGRYVVSVTFVVDEKGVPRHPRVVQSDNEYFDFAAMVSALQWRFKPGMRDGKPVETPLTVQLAFDRETKWSE